MGRLQASAGQPRPLHRIAQRGIVTADKYDTILGDGTLSEQADTVSIVVPMFNEAPGLDGFFSRLDSVIEKTASAMNCTFEIVCVDDGSKDDTLSRLQQYQSRNPALVVVELTRNFGKEAALTAGLDAATGDAVIPMDADLQDPPELIGEMIEKWREGYDVVLAKRKSRAADSALKRITAWAFYRTHRILSDTPIPADVGDFRLLDRHVVDALASLPERRRFMKGLFAWLGYRTALIEYSRTGRQEGGSSWSYWRLWNFALEGLTSFSSAPLRLWSYVGAAIAALAFLYALFVITKTIVFGIDVPGYASLLTAILFLGGLQLLSLGILGEYVGRIYAEVKGRPVYLIRSINGKKVDRGARDIGRSPAPAEESGPPDQENPAEPRP